MNNVPEKSWHALTSAQLSKAIFNADFPEKYVKELPAQTLFLVVKHNGLDSSADLLEMAGLEQCRLLMDFDCWNKDDFQEDNFWAWLAVTDSSEDLKLLKKILIASDLRLVSLLISKYVQWIICEEPTEEPPAPEYFTPDKGSTWVNIKAPDSDKTFLLGRLLAMIFETDAELFYQLLSTTGERTNTEIIEEAYQEKQKRLANEGIPDDEFAYSINAPLSTNEVKAELNKEQTKATISDIRPIHPLMYDSGLVQPLSGLLGKLSAEDFESELTLILNCAIVRWHIELWETEQLQQLCDQVKGAINIGLELCISYASNLTDIEIYNKLGLEKLYRLGLTHVLHLHSLAKKIDKELLKDIAAEKFSLVAGALEDFPLFPNGINKDGTLNVSPTGELEAGFQAYERVSQLEIAKKILGEFLL